MLSLKTENLCKFFYKYQHRPKCVHAVYKHIADVTCEAYCHAYYMCGLYVSHCLSHLIRAREECIYLSPGCCVLIPLFVCSLFHKGVGNSNQLYIS
jgi:hypothetical protein